MKNLGYLLLILLFTSELRPLLRELRIIASTPTINKTYYCFGDHHRNNCDEADNEKQLDEMMAILTRGEEKTQAEQQNGLAAPLLAEAKRKIAYHIMLEARLRFIDYYDQAYLRVLKDLLAKVTEKNFKHITIDNIEIREHQIAAALIMGDPFAYLLKKKLNDASSFASQLARETFSFDIRTFTMRDIFKAYDARLQIAKEQRDSLTDPIARKIYTEDLETIEKENAEKIERYKQYIDQDANILDFAIALNKRAVQERDKEATELRDYLIAKRDFTGELFDLNLFYKVMMLEQQPEIEKVIILAGEMHTFDLSLRLRRTGRYTLLDNFNAKYIGDDRDTPLDIHLFSLIEVPRKNLIWELRKRYWYMSWQSLKCCAIMEFPAKCFCLK